MQVAAITKPTPKKKSKICDMREKKLQISEPNKTLRIKVSGVQLCKVHWP
jgi:hypothetical protein